MHEFRQVFLLGLIAGVVVEIFGVAALSSYFVGGNQTPVYLTGGVCSIVVGIMFLAKSIPVFIPIKKQTDTQRFVLIAVASKMQMQLSVKNVSNGLSRIVS